MTTTRNKMKQSHSSNKIRSRILITALSFTMFMCVLVASLGQYFFQKYLQDSMIQSTEINVKFLTDTINSSISNLSDLIRFCQSNVDIASYLEANPDPSSILAINTHDRITEELTNNASQAYIPRFAVISHQNFLQVVSISYSGTTNLAMKVPKLDGFEEMIEEPSLSFSRGFVPDPYAPGSPKPVLILLRPITMKYNSIRGGYTLIEVSPDLFTTPMKKYTLDEDTDIYLTLGEHIYRFDKSKTLIEEPDAYTVTELLDSKLLGSTSQSMRVHMSDGKNALMVTMPLGVSGCYISQTVSQSELGKQQVTYYLIILLILIAIICFGMLVIHLLNKLISRPLNQILDRMQNISAGDFSRDESIEWDHELGDIGRGINDLSQNVSTLLETRIEDEKQKRELEYKVLQNQINPHFIYNTLNSIKWMAAAQNATGIGEMTTALSRLLRSISKGTSLSIPLREELSLVADYFTIQQYRYGGTISLETNVEKDYLNDVPIIKFTLQPLVENAIFHGIEPKGTAGHIIIHVYEQADDILIDVIDDGVGMTEETAKSILESNDEHAPSFFKEIGVCNVHKRLNYEYGEHYGITVISHIGEGTTMQIRIPGKEHPNYV